MGATQTLMLTGNVENAWELLGDLAELYSDNGGDPDGNAWLPLAPITEDEGINVITGNLGKMVNALYYDDPHDVNDVLKALRYMTVEHFAEINGIEELDLEYYDLLKEALASAVDDGMVGWAGYGNGDVIVVIWRDSAIDWNAEEAYRASL